jgi:hypothetical protein
MGFEYTVPKWLLSIYIYGENFKKEKYIWVMLRTSVSNCATEFATGQISSFCNQLSIDLSLV